MKLIVGRAIRYGCNQLRRGIRKSVHFTHRQLGISPGVVRLSPMETRHAREYRRHDHAATMFHWSPLDRIITVPGNRKHHVDTGWEIMFCNAAVTLRLRVSVTVFLTRRKFR